MIATENIPNFVVSTVPADDQTPLEAPGHLQAPWWPNQGPEHIQDWYLKGQPIYSSTRECSYLSLVASLMSLKASLVTTSQMQQCFNILIDIHHEFLLLFYCCVLLEIKRITTNTTVNRLKTNWHATWKSDDIGIFWHASMSKYVNIITFSGCSNDDPIFCCLIDLYMYQCTGSLLV